MAERARRRLGRARGGGCGARPLLRPVARSPYKTQRVERGAAAAAAAATAAATAATGQARRSDSGLRPRPAPPILPSSSGSRAARVPLSCR